MKGKKKKKSLLPIKKALFLIAGFPNNWASSLIKANDRLNRRFSILTLQIWISLQYEGYNTKNQPNVGSIGKKDSSYLLLLFREIKDMITLAFDDTNQGKLVASLATCSSHMMYIPPVICIPQDALLCLLFISICPCNSK